MTSFALLLGGGPGGSQCGSDSEEMTFVWLSVAFIIAALVICCAAIVAIEARFQYRSRQRVTHKITITE